MTQLIKLAAIAIVVTATSAGFAEDTKTTPKKADTTKKSDPVVVEEFITFGPAHYFHASRDYYRNQDMKAASLELNKAASMLDFAAKWCGKSAPESHTRLAAAATDLREVAAGLKGGNAVPSLKKLEAAVASADHALAWYHYNAQGSKLVDLRGEEAHMAGHHLLVAGQYMEAAAKWAGRPIGEEAVVTVRKVGDHGTRLITENDYTVSSTDPAMKSFGDELVKLGLAIETATKSAVKTAGSTKTAVKK
jgi:hypothetical protein